MWLSELDIFFFKKILVLTSTGKTHSCTIFFFLLGIKLPYCLWSRFMYRINSECWCFHRKPEHDNLVPTCLSQECMTKYTTQGHVVPFGNNENRHQYRIVSIKRHRCLIQNNLPLWTGVCLNLEFILAYCYKKKVFMPSSWQSCILPLYR